MRRIVAIQAGGYLLLLSLFYAWLGIADRSVSQVLLSAVLGIAIVAGALWLIAGALAGPEGFALRRMPKVVMWLAAAALAGVACIWLASYRPRVGLHVASQLTQWFRRPVKPSSIGALYVALLWTAGGAGVLALLPFASRAASGGKTTAVSALRQWRYWIAGAAAGAAGFLFPTLLIGWVPKFQGFAAQSASLLARFAVAYTLALAAWLALAALARRFRLRA